MERCCEGEEYLHVLLSLTFNGREAVPLQFLDTVEIHRYPPGENDAMLRSILTDVVIDHSEHSIYDMQLGWRKLYTFGRKGRRMRSSEGNAFGELLGQFRMEAHLSQQALADLMHRSLGTIGNWERGDHLPRDRAVILELAKQLRLDSLKRDQLLEAALLDPVGPIWTIPFKRNLLFTGREDILQRLHEALYADSMVALRQPQALKGLGGIGKTHTAMSTPTVTVTSTGLCCGYR